MVIFNGFVAGFIAGAVVIILMLFGYSLILNVFEAKATAECGEFLNQLSEAAKEVIEKGDSDNDSND